ncbi:MAG TPA: hypothetical protein VI756_18970 [Blastocatellia bacterium]
MPHPIRKTVDLPEEIETYRDQMWRRNPELVIEDRASAERFIDDVGFCFTLTDSRQAGPSIYIAVCGRRDSHMPRNVQKDPECSLAWRLKDQVMNAGAFYYAKIIKGKSTFIAPRLIPHFNAIWGISRRKEGAALSKPAQSILKVMRKEWEMATADLREASGVTERSQFTRALDELQRAMKVVPSQVVYEPFSYIWMLAEGRFPRELSVKLDKKDALREIARAFLSGAGMTQLGELTRATGLSRSDAGKGHHQLVNEGFAKRLAVGVYRLSSM